ncbi:MAG: hypothetical protein ACRC62_38750 [Microcoleus sp.]
MPSDKPRLTLRLDREEMEFLELWAKEEFLTVPQLARVVVKRAIAEYRKRRSFDASTPSPERTDDSPTETKAPASDQSQAG